MAAKGAKDGDDAPFYGDEVCINRNLAKKLHCALRKGLRTLLIHAETIHVTNVAMLRRLLRRQSYHINYHNALALPAIRICRNWKTNT